MSIANLYAPIKTSGDGAENDFSFNFTIYQKSDIKVSWIVKTTGVATVKTLGVHYDVTINLVTEGGVITFDPAHIPPSTVWVYLESNIPLTQPTSFVTEGRLDERSVGRMGDRLCRLMQQLNRELARSLKLPVGSTLSEFLISEITAGMYLRINSTADGVEMGTPTVTTTDYDGTISAGADASKPASPSAKDIYLATDTKLLYVCVAGGVWTQLNSPGAFFTGLASIPSGAGVIPIANLATGTPTGAKFIRDDGTLQLLAFQTAASQAEMEAAAATDKVVTPGNLNWHPGTLKAGGRFDGTGTPAWAVRYNFDATITDNGAGDYTLTIATDFSSVNYFGAGMAKGGAAGSDPVVVNIEGDPAAGTINVETVVTQTGARADTAIVMIALFGDQ